ncbi:MAG TPA: hypothetical protein VIC08_14095 [Cellvibrionaceae bacterium]
MSRALTYKIIGAALILSGLILLVLKASNISAAQQSWDSWASPESGTLWFVGALAVELAFLGARFALGYFVYLRKSVRPVLFYPLVVLTALSGLSGALLAAPVLIFRFWNGGLPEAKI